MPKRYATVKWVDGEDQGKITVGIPIEHIRRFDFEEFLSENFDPEEAYAVEWRLSNKKPPGGWPTYDAVILDVAGSIAALERKSEKYVFPKSPRLVPSLQSVCNDNPGGSRAHEAEAVRTKNDSTKRRRVRSVVVESSDEDGDHAVSREEEHQAEKTREEEENRNQNGERNDGDERDLNAPPLGRDMQNRVDNPRVPRLPRDHPNLYELPVVPPDPNENRAIDPNVDARLARMENLLERAVRNIPQLQAHPENPDGMVEVGVRGSGVRITQTQWNAAKDQRSFTSMATSLLMSLFPMEVLLTSNVKGGKCKIKKLEENPPIHRALDATIYEAIGVTVRKEFPNTFKQTEMNTAVNVKLNKLRSEARQIAARAAARLNP